MSEIRSRAASRAYRDGWDEVFGVDPGTRIAAAQIREPVPTQDVIDEVMAIPDSDLDTWRRDLDLSIIGASRASMAQ